MKISELQEAIKGWKHAHSDIAKMRSAKAAQSHTAKLVSLKKDGTESRMHDAVSTYPTESEARARHADIVKMNPGRMIKHNLYVDNKLVGVLDTNLQEVTSNHTHKKYMQKIQDLPVVENASSGATHSGSIATVAQAGQPIQRRPSLFGYVPVKIGTKNKKKRGANK